jgi:hypothetical protein
MCIVGKFKCLPALLCVIIISITGCNNSNSDHRAIQSDQRTIQGFVLTGDTAVVGSKISIYNTNLKNGTKALNSTTTQADGSFNLKFSINDSDNGIIFLTTTGGKVGNAGKDVPAQYSLAVVLASSVDNQNVVLNDRTTVASAFALAQFISDEGISGIGPGLAIAANMITNLVDIKTGDPGLTILNDDNEPFTKFSALKSLNEMSNLLASCANNETVCEKMMQLALSLNNTAPTDTFHAAVNMARNPWRDPVPLFDLIASDTYQQDLGKTAPSSWTLALKFKGDPVQLAGPGNMAFDADGQIWIANNLVTDETYVLPDCGSQQLFKMDPSTGKVDVYTGGGAYGAGYGISIAPDTGDIWQGNYGFKGSTCPGNVANNSVSQFASDGTAISPDASSFDAFGNPKDGGWTQGGIGWPQGTVANVDGDIWIASCNGATTPEGQVDVTVYRDGDPDNFLTIIDPDLVKPFDVAFDSEGRAWVSGEVTDNILAYDANGKQLTNFNLGVDSKPMGVASDSRGNIWVSLSGQIELPCPDAPGKLLTGTPGIAMVNINGVQLNTRETTLASVDKKVPGGMEITWGIAVDGDDNVWVANFKKGGLSSFCGANTDACPVGYKTGDALSPDVTGYHSDLLDRNTGVEIDSSGNVWLTNNWKDIPIKPDPAGDGMMVYIGLAAPLKVPSIGTPEKP